MHMPLDLVTEFRSKRKYKLDHKINSKAPLKCFAVLTAWSRIIILRAHSSCSVHSIVLEPPHPCNCSMTKNLGTHLGQKMAAVLQLPVPENLQQAAATQLPLIYRILRALTLPAMRSATISTAQAADSCSFSCCRSSPHKTACEH